MNGLDAEHKISSNYEKVDDIVSGNLSINSSKNDSQLETIDLKGLIDGSKFSEKSFFFGLQTLIGSMSTKGKQSPKNF